MPTLDLVTRFIGQDLGTKAGYASVSDSAKMAAAGVSSYSEAEKRASAASKVAADAAVRASDLRLQASAALREAQRLEAAGDTEGAKAAESQAEALSLQAKAAGSSARELTAAATAAKRQAASMEESKGATLTSSMGMKGLIGHATGLTSALEAIPTPITIVAGALGKLGAVAGVTGLAIGAVSVHAAADFQQATNVFKTAAGESTAGLAVVRNGLMDVARQTGTSLTNLEAGMYILEKAGDHGAAGLKVLTAAAEGAREENADLSDVTNALTSIMASYHIGVSRSAEVMNALKTGAGEAKVTMEQFAGALSTVVPIAATNKIAIGQVLGAIGTLTQHGTSANEATQELASTIRSLVAPNNVAIQQMQQFGLSVNNVSKNIGQRGLTGTVDLLVNSIIHHMGPAGLVLEKAFNQSKSASQDANLMIKAMPSSVATLAKAFQDGSISYYDYYKALKQLPPEQRNLGMQFQSTENLAKGFNNLLKAGSPAAQTFTSALRKISGGAIGLNTILQLSGKNMDGFKDRAKAVTASLDDNSKSVEGWASTQKLFNVELDRAKEGVDVLAIKLGTVLLPAATKAMAWIAGPGVNDLQKFGRWFQQNKSGIADFGVVVVEVFQGITAATLGFAKTFIDGMDDALGWVPGWGNKLDKARGDFDVFYNKVQGTGNALIAKMRAIGDSTGTSLADGLAAGLTGPAEAHALAEANLLGKHAADAVKKGARVASPSLTTKYVGQMLAEGLIEGWTGEAEKIKLALSTPIEDALNNLDDRLGKIITKMTDRLKDSRTKLATFVSSQKSAISTLQGSIAGGANISGIFGTDATTGAPTVGNISQFLGGQLPQLRTEARDLAMLRKKGLSQQLLSQISALPPAQAIAAMQQILSGDDGSIASLNRQESLVQRYAKASATTVVESPREQHQLAYLKVSAALQQEAVAQQRITNRHLERIAAHKVASKIEVTIKKDGALKITTDEAREIAKALKKIGMTASVSV